MTLTPPLFHTAVSQDELDCLFANALRPRVDAGDPPASPNFTRALELLELGANPETLVGPNGLSAIHIAARSRAPESSGFLSALLLRGADPNRAIPDASHRPRVGDTALHFIVNDLFPGSLPQAIEKMSALKQAGADFNPKESLKRTPLSCLCQSSYADERDAEQALWARALVGFGADPNAFGFMEITIFHTVFEGNYGDEEGGVALLSELLSLGARVSESSLATCSRYDPSEAFKAFERSLRERLALERSTPALSLTPARPASSL